MPDISEKDFESTIEAALLDSGPDAPPAGPAAVGDPRVGEPIPLSSCLSPASVEPGDLPSSPSIDVAPRGARPLTPYRSPADDSSAAPAELNR